MKVKKGIEFAVTLSDRPGTLAQLFKKLAALGVNIDAFMLYTSFITNLPQNPQVQGICKILVNNIETARDAFSELGDTFWEEEVLLIRAPDRPGLLATLLDKLAAEGVNVQDGYASASSYASPSSKDEVLITLSVSNIEKGFEILSGTDTVG